MKNPIVSIGPLLIGWLALLAASGVSWGAAVESRVLYETKFEAAQGFDEQYTLFGQGGWLGEGDGGNGLVSGFIAGEGQHAFVGYVAPTNQDRFVTLWRPVGYVPGGTNPPVVRFAVAFSIEDSSARTNRDDFRWSAYNIAGDRLFSLAFDNNSLEINRILDDGKPVATGWTFTNAQPYLLEILIDFPGNQWSATLGGVVISEKQPVTTTGLVRDLGDVDAVWAIRTAGRAGDNFMVFDNYRIVAEGQASRPPPRLQPLGWVRPGEFQIRLTGTPGVKYVIQGGEDLRNWSPLKTNAAAADGTFDYLDRGGGGRRFYRAAESAN